MKVDDEKVEKKATETVECIERIEQKLVVEEKNVDTARTSLELNEIFLPTWPPQHSKFFQLFTLPSLNENGCVFPKPTISTFLTFSMDATRH